MIRPVAGSYVGLTDSWLVCRSAAATPLLLNMLISAVALLVFSSIAAFALGPRVWTPPTTVTVSGVVVTVPMPRVLMPIEAALVAAVDPLPPAQPASASALSATATTLLTPRPISISVRGFEGASGSLRPLAPGTQPRERTIVARFGGSVASLVGA